MENNQSEQNERKFVDASIVPDEVIKDDAFSGGGHSRTANSLSHTIKEFSEKDAAIGLEGKYGAGKSVVIAITQDLLESDQTTKFDYRVFTFDLWTHQSESFRRGYLEELLSWAGPDAEELIDQDDVDEFQADIRDRTVQITSENSQQFHWFAYVLLVAAPLLPLVIAWASPIAWNDEARDTAFNLFGLLPFGPKSGFLAQFALLFLYLLYLIAIWHSYIKSEKSKGLEFEDSKSRNSIKSNTLRQALGEASQPFKTDKAQTEKQTQVIREEDPSTLEFQKLFRRIVQTIQRVDRTPKPVRLVLVFDNIDRLPTARIAGVWGEMRSIFASTVHRKLASHGSVTAIVPFDQSLIDEAFSRDERTKPASISAGRELVSKSFAATLRVAPPVGFDSRAFFFEKLDFATGNQLSETERWKIHRLFDLATLTQQTFPSPRQMIAFVNKLVVLWNERRGDIPPESLALYAVTGDRISRDPTIIFDEAALGNGVDLVPVADQSDWQIHLAALYYNVEVDHVLPILLHREIEATFIEGNADRIRALSAKKHFDQALLAFARDYEHRYQSEDLSNYARILNSITQVELETPAINEAWRILNAIDAYSGAQNTVSAEALSALGYRIGNAKDDQITKEIASWSEFVFKQEFSEANLSESVVPALDAVSQQVPDEFNDQWVLSIRTRTTLLEPDQAIRLIMALSDAENLNASLVTPPYGGFDGPIVEALGQNPSQATAVVRATPSWLNAKLKREICAKLFERMESKLGSSEVNAIFSPIWACVESDFAILDATSDARSKGNLVLLFKQAMDNGDEELAAKAFLVECLGSKVGTAAQYPNRSVDGIGSVQEAINFYNERANDASKLTSEFIQFVASAIAAPTRGPSFREIALKASSTSIYHAAFKQAVRDNEFSTPKWNGAIQTYGKIREILGDELFGRWLTSIASHAGQPDFSYPVAAQVSLLEDIESLEVEDLYDYVEAQNKRFHEFSEDEWISTLENTNELLPLLRSRLSSTAHPLKGLASASRISIRKHLAETLKGQAEWIEGAFYDELFAGLTGSSKTALRTSLAEDVSKVVSQNEVIKSFANAAPEIFWGLPVHKSANDFMRNVFCPLLSGEIEFLVELVERRPDEVQKITKEMSRDTTSLVKDDIAAAYLPSDEERRVKVQAVADAFDIEIALEDGETSDAE